VGFAAGRRSRALNRNWPLPSHTLTHPALASWVRPLPQCTAGEGFETTPTYVFEPLSCIKHVKKSGLNMQSVIFPRVPGEKLGPIPPPLGTFLKQSQYLAREDGFVPRNDRPRLSSGKRIKLGMGFLSHAHCGKVPTPDRSPAGEGLPVPSVRFVPLGRRGGSRSTGAQAHSVSRRRAYSGLGFVRHRSTPVGARRGAPSLRVRGCYGHALGWPSK
jgi:hypothetical protein